MVFYQVIKKGRVRAPWRTVIESDNGERAKSLFASEVRRMRQGHIVLLADGIAQNEYFAYWLRTRW